ncbi:MAG: 50S ribosomal protein L24 [Bacteroidota bacterium]
MQKLKVNDSVVVLAGKDKGKTGKIKTINWKTNRVVVEGVNMVKKAAKPSQQNPQGGLVDMEKAIHVSNVAVADPKSGKATRVKIKVKNGKNVRVTKTGADLK